MSFSVIRPVAFSAQLGPYETFAELQAAAAREMPGTVLIPAPANSTQGRIKGASGEDLGIWTSPPFSMHHPVSFTSYSGPFETMDDLQLAISHQIPGAVLVPPAKKGVLRGSEYSGEVRDPAGNTVGTWIEVR